MTLAHPHMNLSAALPIISMVSLLLAASAGAVDFIVKSVADGQPVGEMQLQVGDATATATADGATESFNLKDMSWFDSESNRWMTIPDCLALLEQSKARTMKSMESAPAHVRPFVQWLMEPSFTVERSKDSLRLLSGHIDYVIAGEASRTSVEAYFRYAVLNAYKKAVVLRKLPPYPELRAIQEMKTLGYIPRVMSIAMPGIPGSPTFVVEVTETQAVGLAADTALAAGGSEQVSAVRSMHAALVKGDYAAFYREWCHPNLQLQLSSEQFVEWITSDRGKPVARLCADIIKAAEGKARPEELVAQPQEQADRYEFILVSERRKSRTERAGAQWHLELQLHEGKWKLLDTD